MKRLWTWLSEPHYWFTKNNTLGFDLLDWGFGIHFGLDGTIKHGFFGYRISFLIIHWYGRINWDK